MLAKNIKFQDFWEIKRDLREQEIFERSIEIKEINWSEIPIDLRY